MKFKLKILYISKYADICNYVDRMQKDFGAKISQNLVELETKMRQKLVESQEQKLICLGACVTTKI